MTITTLKDRIARAEERISKKTNTITKKEALIEKKEAQLDKITDEYEKKWKTHEIEYLRDDIKRLHKEIEENSKKIEEYKQQMVGAMEKEKSLEELPETLKEMQKQLVVIWDEFDKKERQRLQDEYNEIGYREFMKKHTYSDYEMRYKTNDEIHKSNLREAEALILNLVERVQHITGEITSWSGITATAGTRGCPVLNGYVEGKQGRAIVESILAGGYNIQRLHVRVLVKEMH